MKKLGLIALLAGAWALFLSNPVSAHDGGAEANGVAVVEAVGKEVRTTTKAMSEEVVSLTEFSVDKLDKFFGIAETVMEKYGGDAVNLGLNVLRIDAFSLIALPTVVLLIILFNYKKVISIWLYISKKQGEDQYEPWFFLFLFPIGIVILGVAAFNAAFNLWAWIGVFYPEIYAVYKYIL